MPGGVLTETITPISPPTPCKSLSLVFAEDDTEEEEEDAEEEEEDGGTSATEKYCEGMFVILCIA